MKNKFLYLSLLIIFMAIAIAAGLYLVELQKEKENIILEKGRNIEIATQKIIENAKKMKETKQATIVNLYNELSFLNFEIYSLKKDITKLEDKKIELEMEAEENTEEITILKVEIVKLEGEKKVLEDRIKQLPDKLEQKLKDLTWIELKEFLRKDRTNEMIFNDKDFDCSGFAITLFRNARAHGIRAAYAEVIFRDYGHALNKFKTTDRGYVFIDNTGNRYGTGLDTVAYIKKGELFGTIYIGAILEQRINCTKINLCTDFINPLPTKKHTQLFNYSYFEAVVNCGELYNRCLIELNKEIERFNARQGYLTLKQLNNWIENNKKLLNELTKNNKFIFTELKKVTNIEIYW